jgi:hypothetical protein
MKSKSNKPQSVYGMITCVIIIICSIIYCAISIEGGYWIIKWIKIDLAFRLPIVIELVIAAILLIMFIVGYLRWKGGR